MISDTLKLDDLGEENSKKKVGELSRNKYSDFIEDRFSDEVVRVDSDSVFNIDLSKDDFIDHFSEGFYNDFISNPKLHISALESSVEEELSGRDVDFDDIEFDLDDFMEPVNITDLRTNNVGDLVCVEGIISLSGSVKPLINKASFKCSSCGELNRVIHTKDQIRHPSVCKNSDCNNSAASNFELIKSESKNIDFQKVNIKEPPEKAEGDPENLFANLFGHSAGSATVSERVEFIGILEGDLERTNSGMIKSPVMDKYLHVISVKKEQEEFEDLEPTDKEEEKILELSNNPNIYEALKKNICPSLTGYDTIKEAVTLQLFSGVTKKLDGGKTHLRGDIHILIVGDPALGKSQLLKFVGKITPRGTFSSGKGSTSAGLTASAVQEDLGDSKEWVIKAGTLALADGGVACIDEFDKMSQNDRDSIHEALEQQTISVDKAGMKATLNSRCALLASSNPEDERFVPEVPEHEQIGLEPALRSRFDLIFTVKDVVNEEKDRNLAKHIMNSNRGKEQEEKDLDVPDISHDMFKKYIAYARKNCEPDLSDEAEKILNDYYISLRKESSDERVSVTVRTLQGLIRLAESSAKVRLSDNVEVEDAKRAKRLMEISLNDVMRDEDGELDADIKETDVTAKERKKKTENKRSVKQIIRDLEKEETEKGEEGEAHKENIIDNAVNDGLSREKAEKHFEQLRDIGHIYKTGDNTYTLV